MKKILITLTIFALAPAFITPAAEAGIFSVGVSFNVGGLFFDLGFGGPHYGAHARHHVYRASEPFHYRGYECHSGCYRDAGYTYHHANCPAVAYHFRSHRFDAYAAYPSFFAPRSYGYYNYGYYGRYPSRHKHYRYDRHRSSHHHYRGQRYYRDSGRHHRKYDRGRSHHNYRRDDRHRDRSRHYDRGHRDHRGRSAYSTRPRAQRRDVDRNRGDRNRDRRSTRSRRPN